MGTSIRLVGVVENTNGNPLIFLRQQPTDYKLIRRNSGEFFISLAILVIRQIRLIAFSDFRHDSAKLIQASLALAAPIIRREKKKFACWANFLKYR